MADTDDIADDTAGKHLGRLLAAIRAEDRLSPRADETAVDPKVATQRSLDPSMSPWDPSAATKLRAGVLVRDTWEISELMGKGGFGQVFIARHRELERDDAIKFLHPHLADDEEIRNRFKQEAMVMAKLQGDHLVHVHDYGEHEGVPFFVMERLRGESLHERLQRDHILPLPAFYRIASGILRGLAEIHDKGIVHRDIKPANIFVLDGTDRVKLLDFGLAMTSLRLTSQGAIMGTPLFMAPELLLSSDTKASIATDIYSTGIVLYQMLTGKVPFLPRSQGALSDFLHQVITATPRSPRVDCPEIPEALEDIVLRAIDRDPAQRPPSAKAFVNALDHVRLISMETPSEALAFDVSEEMPAVPLSSGRREVAHAHVLPLLDSELSTTSLTIEPPVPQQPLSPSGRGWMAAAAALALLVVGAVAWSMLDGENAIDAGRSPPTAPSPTAPSLGVPSEVGPSDEPKPEQAPMVYDQHVPPEAGALLGSLNSSTTNTGARMVYDQHVPPEAGALLGSLNSSTTNTGARYEDEPASTTGDDRPDESKKRHHKGSSKRSARRSRPRTSSKKTGKEPPVELPSAIDLDDDSRNPPNVAEDIELPPGLKMGD